MKKILTILLTLIASLSLGLIIHFLFNVSWFISGLIIFIVLLSHSLLFGITEKLPDGVIHKEQESAAEKSEHRKAIVTQILLIVISLIAIVITIYPN